MHAVRSCMAQRAHHRLKPPWNCGWVTQRSDWSYQRNVAEVAKTSRKIEFTVPSRSQISYGGIPWIASTKASGVRCTASHPAIWRLPDHTFAFCICRGEPWAHLQVRMLTCWLLEVIFWCCGARSLIIGGSWAGFVLEVSGLLGFCDVNGKMHSCVSSYIAACLQVYSDFESHSKREKYNGKRLGWCGVSSTGTSFGKLQASIKIDRFDWRNWERIEMFS
jgi:hypothetical protein